MTPRSSWTRGDLERAGFTLEKFGGRVTAYHANRARPVVGASVDDVVAKVRRLRRPPPSGHMFRTNAKGTKPQ